MKKVAFAVEILRLRFGDFGVFYLVVALEGFFQNGTGAQVFDAGAENGSGASRFAVLVVEHGVGIVAQENCFSGFDIGERKHRNR